MRTLLKYEKFLWLILIIGFIVYSPIFLNGFVWDDFAYILDNTKIHQLNFPALLGPNVFNSGAFYRPIPAIYFASLYSLFGQHAFFYHILQLILHAISTGLLFLLFCMFFSESISFFLALLFLIHPVNVESVAFIAATPSQLLFIPGISAFLIATQRHLTLKKILVASGLILLSLLAKETGILFLLLIIAYRFLFKLGKLKTWIVSGTLIGIIYVGLRIFLGGVSYRPPDSIIASIPLSQRLLNIPAITMYYIKMFVFPLHLVFMQYWGIRYPSFADFTFPLLLCLVLAALLIIFAYLLYQSGKKQPWNEQRYFRIYIFFLFWFIIGIGLILQLVPLDTTVADRWFYFPIVGLLGIVGTGSQWILLQKENMERADKTGKSHKELAKIERKKTRKGLMILSILILSVYSVRTFVRNTNWHDFLGLMIHDSKIQDNYMIENNIGYLYFQNKQYDLALEHFKKSVEFNPFDINVYNLANTYESLHKISLAEKYFYEAVKYKGKFQFYSDLDLTILLLKYNPPQQALKFITTALHEYPKSGSLWAGMAIAEYYMNNQKEAVSAAVKAKTFRPSNLADNLYMKISLKQLNRYSPTNW